MEMYCVLFPIYLLKHRKKRSCINSTYFLYLSSGSRIAPHTSMFALFCILLTSWSYQQRSRVVNTLVNIIYAACRPITASQRKKRTQMPSAVVVVRSAPVVTVVLESLHFLSPFRTICQNITELNKQHPNTEAYRFVLGKTFLIIVFVCL